MHDEHDRALRMAGVVALSASLATGGDLGPGVLGAYRVKFGVRVGYPEDPGGINRLVSTASYSADVGERAATSAGV
ncbi:hypothetical protein VTJ04DRAFT_9371 [Mycothermus thermophilus]|uniref:uncharacterized protein n=1 Tax=Humicola insolens TaxID=85995 RepID=UPI00374368E2